MEAMPKNNERNIPKLKFEDIFRDKNKDFKSENLDWSWLDNLSPEQLEEVEINLRLLSYLNGHKGADLRNISQKSSTPEANHLNRLLAWSKAMSSQGSISVEILKPAPESIRNIGENELYERIYFLDKNPDTSRENISNQVQAKFAEVLRIKSEKWIDLIDPLFDNPKLLKDIINNFGLIPEEIFTKKKFKSVEPNKIIFLINELRKLEDTNFKNESLRARARLINHLFISKRAETIRSKDKKNVSLDTNGIIISMHNFHSHLPYGLIDDLMIDELTVGNWLDQKSADEIKIMRASSNNLQSEVLDIVSQQDKTFSEALNCKKEEFFTLLKNKGSRIVARKIIEQDLIIPISWLDSVRTSEDSFLTISLAEEITSVLSDAEPRSSYNLSDYSTSAVVSKVFDAQSKIVNSKHYYNVSRLMNCFFLNTPESSVENKYAVVKSEYKVSNKGDTQSFVAAIHEDKIARVLINERKHVSPQIKDSFGKIPSYSRTNYENLEASMNVFDSFVNSLNAISSFSETSTEGIDDNLSTTKEELLKYIENCLHFVLNNVSDYYNQSLGIYESIRLSQEVSLDKVNELTTILLKVKEVYSQFLYKNILEQDTFENHFSPEITKGEIKFGDEFLAEVQKVCPGNFDEGLSGADFSVRVVSLNYKLEDPSQTIPFHIEESCLDALRINRQRPLLNIIGGCKHLDGGKNPLEVFSDSVMNVAHKYKANVGIPQTQSGIGINFGSKNIEYERRFGSLPFAEKAHFFTISPGGSVYFPENKFLEKDGKSSVYANTTVDTFMTPIPAEWNKKGRDKYTSKYITHIAYMEALYSKMSINQKHIMVVGNGGLFSIMEINESLKRGVELLLVKNTGRFAEAASILVGHIDEILNSETMDREILNILKEKMNSQSFEEFCKKDFGYEESPENEDYEVYRDYFRNFLLLAQKNIKVVRSTELENLEQSLDDLLKEKK